MPSMPYTQRQPHKKTKRLDETSYMTTHANDNKNAEADIRNSEPKIDNSHRHHMVLEVKDS